MDFFLNWQIKILLWLCYSTDFIDFVQPFQKNLLLLIWQVTELFNLLKSGTYVLHIIYTYLNIYLHMLKSIRTKYHVFSRPQQLVWSYILASSYTSSWAG